MTVIGIILMERSTLNDGAAQRALESAKAGSSKDRSPQVGGLQVIGSSPDCAVGIIDCYVLLCWRRSIVQIGSTWARKAFAEVRRQRPDDKIAFFTVVDAACSLNTPAEVRNDLAALLKTYDAQLAGATITFEGKGFKMTMVRSIITAIYMASRSKFPNSVFGDVETAATWLSERAPALRPSGILAGVGKLRA